MEAPVPVQQHTIAWSALPAATSRAAASEQTAHRGSAPGLRAPYATTSWPRARSSSSRVRATGSSMSEETEIRMSRAYSAARPQDDGFEVGDVRAGEVRQFGR